MFIYIILCVLVTAISIFVAILVANMNKFKEMNTKISIAEDDANQLLQKKLDLLININECVNKKIKDKENDLSSVIELKATNLDKFQLNTELSKYDKTILELTDFNKDIEYNEEEIKMFDELSDTSVQCLSVEKYYNDNVVKYNSLVKAFPASFVAKLKHYKSKGLFTNEKEEIFEILKK